MEFKRSSGILLHPTSLPGRFGIGDLGPEAYRFIDWLAAAGQSFWQIMPLGPTGYGDSPYSSFSAFAGNTNLISPEKLVESGLLAEQEVEPPADLPEGRVDYGRVIEYKRGLLERAFQNFKTKVREDEALRRDYEGFLGFASRWLEDYVLFAALKDEHKGEPWNTWAPGLARREMAALDGARLAFSEPVQAHKFFQYVFFEQWLKLKRYANERGVRVVGDMPIFVAHNSADVWAGPSLFNLKEDGSPRVVAGVPPDAFSETGQLWGNPIYDWGRMREDGFAWWVDRMRETLKIVDVVRVDHFRGFAAYWEVPAEHETALHGRWVEGPGEALFDAVTAELGRVPMIVEDLGEITPDVIELREHLGFPGMKVLQFAFGDDAEAVPTGRNPYLPHNYEPDFVVYTGTHDNDTTAGWFASLGAAERAAVLRYLGKDRGIDDRDALWDLIRLAFASVAHWAIVPLQDVLGLGSEARMNVPGRAEGNWAWRYAEGALTRGHTARLAELTATYGRATVLDRDTSTPS